MESAQDSIAEATTIRRLMNRAIQWLLSHNPRTYEYSCPLFIGEFGVYQVFIPSNWLWRRQMARHNSPGYTRRGMAGRTRWR